MSTEPSISRSPSAAQGDRERAAGVEPAARTSTDLRDAGRINLAEAEELLASVGFLLVPGPPFDRGPAYLMAALRKSPTLEHFDPERIEVWASDNVLSTHEVLERPLPQPSRTYAWGTIDVIDRIGATNRFVSFGGEMSALHEKELDVVLMRSTAPILCAGGHSDAADPLGTSIAAYFGVLRARAGDDVRLDARIRVASPDALYAAFLNRSLSSLDSRRLRASFRSTLDDVLRGEIRRLERDCAADARAGAQLARDLA